MSKGIDKQKITLLIKNIEKKFGKGAIYVIGSDADLQIPRVSTGIEDLDWAIGGGLPKGRIIELFGVNSAGKTTLAYHLASRFPLALFIDAEGTFDPRQARVFGNKKGQLFVRRPSWGEQAIEAAFDFAEAGVPFIIIDSVPAMIPRKEFEGRDFEKQEGIGLVASLMSRKLPKLCYLCENSGTTILFINQIRDKIGGFMFGDPYTTPGGHCLKHMASLRIRITRKEWLRMSDELMGQICKIKVVKSKVCSPMREAELPLVFNHGFVTHEETRAVMKDIRAKRKQKSKTGKEAEEMGEVDEQEAE